MLGCRFQLTQLITLLVRLPADMKASVTPYQSVMLQCSEVQTMSQKCIALTYFHEDYSALGYFQRCHDIASVMTAKP